MVANKRSGASNDNLTSITLVGTCKLANNTACHRAMRTGREETIVILEATIINDAARD